MRRGALSACAVTGAIALLGAALLMMTSCGGDEVKTETETKASLP